jgi:hypothetical protein
MARARNIKPGFFKNEDLSDLGPLAQLLFAGLWCLADRQGRLEDRPRFIKSEIFPYYDCDVNGELTKLERLGFVRRYKVNGMAYIVIDKFKKHQSPHSTEKASELPGEDEADPSAPCQIRATDDNGESTVDSRKDNGGNPPDSLIHRFTDSPIPDSLIPREEPVPPTASQSSARKKVEPESSETWRAYAVGYHARYGASPVRNATVNAQMANFVKRIGHEEAPAVAAWYLAHNGRYYVQNLHPVSAMLKDAEKLRTEWFTRRQMTSTEALQTDKTQTNLNAFAPLIEEARRREAKEASDA